MKLLNHLNPADYELLRIINDDWPFPFLSEYSRFNIHFLKITIYIVYDEQLRAYMPLGFRESNFFTPAQILFAPHCDAIEIDEAEQSAFFDRLILLLSGSGLCNRMTQPHPYGILATHPAGSKHCNFGSYIVNLENQDEEEIFKKFHPKYQKAIAHSQKNGATVKIGRETLSDFYAIYASTMKRAGMFTDTLDYFNTLYNYLGNNRVSSAVVYDQDNPVSGIFIIYTRYGAFLTHAGTSGESKLYGAAKLLNYEMMKYLKKRGVKRYDFVGVRLNNNNKELEGIFRFKKGFGGDLKVGYLWKKDITPFKAMTYDFLLKFKPGRKKIIDIIDQVNQ